MPLVNIYIYILYKARSDSQHAVLHLHDLTLVIMRSRVYARAGGRLQPGYKGTCQASIHGPWSVVTREIMRPPFRRPH